MAPLPEGSIMKVTIGRFSLFVCRNLPKGDRHRKGWGRYSFTHRGRTGHFVWAGPLHAQLVIA